MTAFDRLTAKIEAANRAAETLEQLGRQRQQLVESFAAAEQAAAEGHRSASAATAAVDAMIALAASIDAVERQALGVVTSSLADFAADAGGEHG